MLNIVLPIALYLALSLVALLWGFHEDTQDN